MKLSKSGEWIIVGMAWACGYLGYFVATADGWAALGASILFPLVGILTVFIVNRVR